MHTPPLQLVFLPLVLFASLVAPDVARAAEIAASEVITFTKATAPVRSEHVYGGLVEVLVPTGYDPGKRYRTLYLLHPRGRSEPCLRYLAATGLADRHDLVCVSVELGWDGRWTGYDVPGKKRPGRQAAHLLEAVVPRVERAFATGGRPEARLLIGFRQSGEAVLRILLRHGGVFGAAAAIEPTSCTPRKPADRAAVADQEISALVAADPDGFAGRKRVVLLGHASARSLDRYAALFEQAEIPCVRGQAPWLPKKPEWTAAMIRSAVEQLMKQVGPAAEAGAAPGTAAPARDQAAEGFVSFERTVCRLPRLDGKGTREMEVVLPENYDPKGRHRVLYLLSACGRKDTESLRQVVKLGLHDRHDLICVLPTMGGWYPQSSADWMKRVLVPHVERTYATRGDAEGRLLLGFSKSGWGALSLILCNPDFFGYAASWDAPLMWEDKMGLAKGSYKDMEEFRFYQPVGAARRQAAHFRERERLVVHGTAFWGDHAKRYHELLDSIGIRHHYQEVRRKGGHNWRSGWLEPALAAMVEQAERGGEPE